MDITPADIWHMDLQKTWLRGYRRGFVDELLEEIADSYGAVVRERERLAARVEELEAEAAQRSELETLLRSTLVSAESAAQEMKEQARRESDLIVHEAHAEARRVTRESAAEKRRLEDDLVRIRAQLLAAFETLGEWPRNESTTSEDANSAAPAAAIAEAVETGVRNLHTNGAPTEVPF
jgi:cell division initiation protein